MPSMPLPANLPLFLLQSGSALIAVGIIYGAIVPLTPFPRLGLTAHIQFISEGMFVVCAGLVLHCAPPGLPKRFKTLAESLSPLQANLIFGGCAILWFPLISEALNAWWGTRQTLPLAAEAAHVLVDAPQWQETLMFLAHIPSALPVATVVSVLRRALSQAVPFLLTHSSGRLLSISC